MLPVTLVGNILRGILPARLQVFLLVKLYAILRARLQVMLLVILLAISGARLQVMLLVMVCARWRCATSPCNVMHKIACKLVRDTNSYVMHNIACEVVSGATYNFTRHIACKVARVTICVIVCASIAIKVATTATCFLRLSAILPTRLQVMPPLKSQQQKQDIYYS